uniref:Aminotransferase class V-fold PLP-dependent enzyme n=1 Tax=Phenylobacterium glaciei TaxID=2803784 RepID=A0A974P4B6_9CAUL|nr:aminotransferase class V-fold PLP-dependent enzyme [Phenylobacterium glaciei]
MGPTVDPAKVEAALAGGPVKVLAFVHAETSTGAKSDAAALCALARKYGALSVVDCVTSLGGITVDAGAWDADVIYSGTQKCLSAPRPIADLPVAARPDGDQRPDHQGPQLAFGFQPADGLLGRRGRPDLSPHGADQCAVWPA